MSRYASDIIIIIISSITESEKQPTAEMENTVTLGTRDEMRREIIKIEGNRDGETEMER